MRADGDEHRVKALSQLLRKDIRDLVVKDNFHSHVLDALDLLHQILSREPIGGNSKM